MALLWVTSLSATPVIVGAGVAVVKSSVMTPLEKLSVSDARTSYCVLWVNPVRLNERTSDAPVVVGALLWRFVALSVGQLALLALCCR